MVDSFHSTRFASFTGTPEQQSRNQDTGDKIISGTFIEGCKEFEVQ
jgi:hypothetical protein